MQSVTEVNQNDNTAAPESPEGLRFTIDSSLLFQLGERMVAKPSIALAELVKNAYDADATEVKVHLDNVNEPGGTILIEDNGHGMTFEEVQTGWMRIATPAKRKNPVSRKYNRPLTGAKGVGRFAARRLGSKLTLQSVAERSDKKRELVVIDFAWEEDFAEGKDLAQITVSPIIKEVPRSTNTGVSLLISGARDAWTVEELSALKRDLLSLQNPFSDLVVGPSSDEREEEADEDQEQVKDLGFKFELHVEGSKELDNLSGELGEDFLKTAFAKLDGWVEEDGQAHYEIDVLKTGEKQEITDESNNYKGLEGARFRVYVMIYRDEFYKSSDFGLKVAQKKGREEGGVRIYLDGFRVFPYGEAGDDWLLLDEYAAKNLDLATIADPPEPIRNIRNSLQGRPFLLVPKNNQVFGVVVLSQAKHPNIEINVTRDRLIETLAVKNLRRFVQNGIYWAGMKWAAYRADERSRNKKGKIKTATDLIEEAKSAIAELSDISQERRQLILRSLDRAMEQVEEEEQDRISELSMLRILASAGTTITLLNHQMRALNGSIIQIEKDLSELREEVPKKLWKRFHEIITQVSEWRETMQSQTSQIGFLLSPENRNRRRKLALYEVVEDVRKSLSFYMKKYGVTFNNHVPRTLRTPPIYLSELYSILMNIMSNALKAIHGRPERVVAVEAERRGRTLFLRMKDTGIGLPVNRRETVFKAFETSSLPNPILGVGTGLGLKVVRDIVDLYGGTARFIDVDKPWKTCIEITIPERGAEDGH